MQANMQELTRNRYRYKPIDTSMQGLPGSMQI